MLRPAVEQGTAGSAGNPGIGDAVNDLCVANGEYRDLSSSS